MRSFKNGTEDRLDAADGLPLTFLNAFCLLLFQEPVLGATRKCMGPTRPARRWVTCTTTTASPAAPAVSTHAPLWTLSPVICQFTELKHCLLTKEQCIALFSFRHTLIWGLLSCVIGVWFLGVPATPLAHRAEHLLSCHSGKEYEFLVFQVMRQNVIILTKYS